MENKSYYDKELFVTIALQKFIIDYRRNREAALQKQAERIKQAEAQGQDADTIKAIKQEKLGIKVDSAYENLLILNKNNAEKRNILENCKALFESDSTQKEVDLEIATIYSETNATKGRNPTDSEIAKWLIKCFSEEILAINKRTYDMSQIATKGMLSTKKTAQGSILKVVGYVSYEERQKNQNQGNVTKAPPRKVLRDRHGNTIEIQLMGWLAYRTPASDEYIYKHSIRKTINGVSQDPVEVYSNMDIVEMSYNKEYCNLVVSELLSHKNLTCSNADNYIGEIFEESSLQPGQEKLDLGLYTYQISPKYALVYNGERIEAIRAYKQQEALKKDTKQSKKTPVQSGDEPDL